MPSSASRNDRFRWLPFAAALLAYGLMFAWSAAGSHRANDNRLVYSLDDAYIHMAMARNIAVAHTFGVTPYEFSASTSSPLWTAFLAGVYGVAGVSQWPPLALNVLFGAAALGVAWWWGRAAGLGAAWLAALLFGVLVPTLLVLLAFTGMEHSLQIAAVLAWAYFLWRSLAATQRPSAGDLAGLALSAMIAVGVRYETLFLVAPAVLILALGRRWRAAIACAVCAAIPVVAFGWFSVAHGGDWLPNSLLLKAQVPAIRGLADIAKLLQGNSIGNMAGSPHLCALLACLVLVFAWRRLAGVAVDALDQLGIVVFCGGAAHLWFARVGLFFRYEAYLVALAFPVLCLQIADLWRRVDRRRLLHAAASTGAAALMVAAVIFARPIHGHQKIVTATGNIYQQQYQMARFLHRYYDADAVAANDVGAITFFTKIRCLDLWGLACQEITAQRRSGVYSTDAIRRLASDRGVRVAVVYTTWFRPPTSLPAEWRLVGSWTIPNNTVCGDSTVSFFAVRPSEAAPLAAHFREFSASLPRGVAWNDVAHRSGSAADKSAQTIRASKPSLPASAAGDRPRAFANP